MSKQPPLAIVGAGPYGLSVAAHLAAAGVEARVFGDVMETWRDNMPEGMFLKSEGFASSLSDPERAYTLGHHCRAMGLPYADTGWPVPVSVFASYGVEFARRFVPSLDPRRVSEIARSPGGFRVRLEDGAATTFGRVVVATGISPFARVPDEIAHLPASVLTHSSRHADYSIFRGRAVAVIGAGASALDAAAALRRSGAAACLVTRRPEVRFYGAGRPRSALDAILSPLTPLGPGWKKWLCCGMPLLFHALPERLRLRIVQRYLGPSPARFVRDEVENHVPYRLRSRVAGAAVTSDGRVALAIDRDGVGRDILTVDHVVAATGYRVDVARLGFLDPGLVAAVTTVDGSPALSRCFESSVPGLFFVGTPSACSFGPMFRFACGAEYTARRLTRSVVGADRAGRRTADRASVGRLQPDASRS